MSQQGAFSAGLVPRDFSGMPIEEMLARLEELEVDIMACDPLAGPVMSVRRLQDALYIGLELVSRNGKLEREVQELTEELKSQKECCVSLLKRAPEVRAACGTRVEAYASGSMCRSIIERTVQHHKMAKELYESLCEDDTTASMTTLWSAMEPVQDSQNLVLRASTTGSTFVCLSPVETHHRDVTQHQCDAHRHHPDAPLHSNVLLWAHRPGVHQQARLHLR